MASSSSSSSVTLRMKFDVFLSFRGEDTRNNFTDHLYAALVQKGFDTFRDEEKLPRGTEISSELLDAIEESSIAIVVLSKRYAESTWCLEELAKIIDCMEEKGQIVLPVFYNVDPSDVRKQAGDFKEAFDRHEEKFKEKKGLVEKWRAAFAKIGKLSGWHLQDKSEAKVISEIIAKISERKHKALLTDITRDLFGIDSHLEKIHEYLDIETNDVRFIGIHGMGGIGKTTIARVLYENLSFQYEGGSFLKDVREVSGKQGLAHLQQQLLSEVLLERNLRIWNDADGECLISRRLHKKKILLVLDDVDDLKQLEMLAGNCNWFGPGSRVIITTRDEHLLVNHGVSWKYKVKKMNDDDALQLFQSKAFKQVQPTAKHFGLSCRLIRYANGLPLAVKILASDVCDRSINELTSYLNRLEKAPPKKISDVLQISYDGLEEDQKEIFLDIACFFKGEYRHRVIDILKYCDRCPDIVIKVLVEKSLITISYYGTLEMHDLVQELGWKIVRGQHPNEPGKWSRLWLRKDIHDVLTNNKGTEAIQVIFDEMPYSKKIINCNGTSFSRMSNLRLLRISNLFFSEDLEYLSNELRILKWRGYPLRSLPSSFQPNKLVELNMHNSKMEYLWKGKMRSETLKTMELRDSNNLIELPDFTDIQNLECLNLRGCTRLTKVHESVGFLAKLSKLNLRNCKNLVSLPCRVSGMKSLVFLDLGGCSKLKELPPDMGAMECLEWLDVSETQITKLPPSVVELRKLSTLNLRGIKGWSWWMLIPKRKVELPPLTNCQYLKELDLSGLNLETCPDFLGSLVWLENLCLSGNNFVSLSESISQLSNLCRLEVRECKRLRSLIDLTLNVIQGSVDAYGCTSLETFGNLDFSNIESDEDCYPSSFIFTNCMKLLENQSGTHNCIAMWLKKWLQANMRVIRDYMNRLYIYGRSQFEIVVPGSEIPHWINIQKDNDSLVVKLPPLRSNHEFIGFIFCAIVKPNEVCDSPPISDTVDFSWATESYGLQRGLACVGSPTLTCHHLMLLYTPFSKSLPVKAFCQETYARLKCKVFKRDITVEKCGIRLLYREDLEKLEEVSNNIGRVYEPAECQGNEELLSFLNNLPSRNTRDWVKGTPDEASYQESYARESETESETESEAGTDVKSGMRLITVGDLEKMEHEALDREDLLSKLYNLRSDSAVDPRNLRLIWIEKVPARHIRDLVQHTPDEENGDPRLINMEPQRSDSLLSNLYNLPLDSPLEPHDVIGIWMDNLPPDTNDVMGVWTNI